MERRPSRIELIKDWLDEHAAWIEAAPNVQLVFDCAGSSVKARPAWSEQLRNDGLREAG